MNKHLKWLIPVVAVLLAAIAGFTWYLMGRTQKGNALPDNVQICWNVDAAYYRGDPKVVPSRQTDDNGNFFVQFAMNGQQMRLQVTEEVLKKGLDMYDLVGIVQDENGLVVDFYTIEECTGGYFAKGY